MSLEGIHGSSLVHLTNRWPWFGAHTGYHLLPEALRAAGYNVFAIDPTVGTISRLLGKTYSVLRGWRRSDSYSVFVELRAWLQTLARGTRLVHVLYLEEHAQWLAPIAKQAPVVGTIHQPFPWWSSRSIAPPSGLACAILMYRRDVPLFTEYLGIPVEFIHYGVDTVFFAPSARHAPAEQNQLLCVGHHLRNFPMLTRVMRRLSERHRSLRIVMVMAREARNHPDLDSLKAMPSVSIRSEVSDEELLTLYRRSYLLLLPAKDIGASNAIVEALACGLPIVGTDVGGIRDYGGGGIFPIVPDDDDEGMVSLAERYLDDPVWRDQIGRECRNFAERELAWPVVAARHAEVYERVVATHAG